MPNDMFRNRAINVIKNAMAQFREAVNVDHPGLKGDIRELGAKGILEPFLPEDFKIKTSGKIIDAWGKQSSEIDLIIYSKRKLPPVMFEKEDFLFPSETVFYAIEVKSEVTAAEIKSAHIKAKELISNIVYLSGLFTPDDQPIQHTVNKIIPGFFAYSSDLKEGGKSEIERYKEILGPGEAPSLYVICVVGKGYWYQRNDKWLFHPATANYDEVINFVSGVVNTLHKNDETRGYPRLGNYLMLDIPPIEII